ncbi:hypothetical protein GCM10007972_09880 [Iodidimonas muriae]|uniref:ATP synthase protein I n=1 Tax=Iodidimonas muriae TaxID=261467 RepID=A0ABQ2LAV8_9PROT|nr:AtpZ/AtpI family protein [Iodidimonas muriae]GER08074.1 hypothetical protein JCM17843_23840 [Kordiimonadales bacterium JCM 17843]GGO08940.1 hypothetical protein GCM10007972_09880 [Iodidimonas muriae]
MDPETRENKKSSFDKRLAEARAKIGKHDDADGQQNKDADDGQSLSHGYRMGLEFVSAVAVGAFIGYWLDRWFGTSPIFLIGMFLIGTLTGFRNLMRLLESTNDETDDKAGGKTDDGLDDKTGENE